MTATLLCALLLAAQPDHATVTLPLSEFLEGQPRTPDAPPLGGAVLGQRLTGRVTGDGVEVTAQLVVSVIDTSRWTRLALFKLTPGVTLTDASQVEGALVAVQGGEVVLVSKTAGTWTLDLRFSLAGSGGPQHLATLTRAADVRDGVLRLEVDAEQDELLHGAELLPRQGTWSIRWKSRAARRAQAVVARAPMEPVISAAQAQLVSTVEGRARLTVRYALELDREHPLTLRLPEAWTLTRVGINGAPRVVPEGREVSWAVGPARPGEKTAALELTLERDLGVFHLSGRLGVALPGASWPTARVEASVHLPPVFEWRRLGGSLEPTESLAWSPPTMPGRQLLYQQHLVAAAGPTLELAYSVDLAGRYFSLRGAP